jgi:ABC-2 type transport system permease protein
MSKVLLVFFRELSVKLKNKWFWLAAILIPIGVLIATAIPILLTMITSSQIKTPQIGVIDPTNSYFPALKSNSNVSFVRIENQDTQTLKTQLSNAEKGEMAGFIELKDNLDTRPTLFSRENISFLAISDIEEQLDKLRINEKLKTANLDQKFLDIINNRVRIDNTLVKSDGKEEDNNQGFIYAVTFIISISIYVISSIFGAIIMTSVVEEKSSRIAEILIATIKPSQLLFGKVLGQMVAIIIQFTVGSLTTGLLSLLVTVISIGFNLSRQKQSINFPTIQQQLSNMNSNNFTQTNNIFSSFINNLNISLPIYFILITIFFVIGMIFMASWYAAIGATADNAQAANNSPLSWIIALPSIISVFFIQQIARDPNSTIASVLSFMPFTSFVIMPARLAFNPPLWHIGLSLILTIVYLIISFIICGKIYRIGLLSYGKTASLKDLWVWIFKY